MKKIALFACLLLSATMVKAQTDEITEDDLILYFKNDSILKSFKYQTGKVVIGENLATINVPAGCLYLNPEESKYMLENIFGNPPSPASLGMLLSDTPDIAEGAKWIVDFNYSSDGHINDEDAADINYDDLLKQLIEEAEAASKDRVSKGYESVKMLGWAQAPFYDSKSKKLHWAKELVFGKDEAHTLNYNIRILGREGFLELNIITTMDRLTEVKKDINMILASTDFNQGQRYADFNESTDKLAEYGIGGLIVGGVLAKTGLLAKIGLFLVKIIKPLIVGIIALFGYLYKRITGRRKEEEEFNTINQAPDTDITEDNKTQD